MDIQQLRKQLEIDEGVKYDIYLDHLGLPTFGIGHLVTKTDPESGQAVGTPISKERVAECFDMDVQSVINDCNKLYEDFEDFFSRGLKEADPKLYESLSQEFVRQQEHIELRISLGQC